MHPETTLPPPEARLIRKVRQASGMTAAQAAQATSGAVSATYWRDIERGSGYRRGERVAARGSDTVIARMAFVLGISPRRLETEGERPEAAVILREMLGTGQEPAPALAAVPEMPPADQGEEDAKAEFMDLIMRHPKEEKVLMAVARTLDSEGQPFPWAKRLEIARGYLKLSGAEEQNPGSTGTALLYALARPALSPLLQQTVSESLLLGVNSPGSYHARCMTSPPLPGGRDGKVGGIRNGICFSAP